MTQKHRHKHRHRHRHHKGHGGQGPQGQGQQGQPFQGQHQGGGGQQEGQPPQGGQQGHQGGQHRQGGGGGGGGGGGPRYRIIVDLDEALGMPLTNGVTITGFNKRPGCDQLLERLSRRHNLLLWSSGSKRYVDKILQAGLRRYFREIYSGDELPAAWKDIRKLRADYVIDVAPEHKKYAEQIGMADRYIIIPAVGSLEDEADPLAWTRQIEAVLLPPAPAITPGAGPHANASPNFNAPANPGAPAAPAASPDPAAGAAAGPAGNPVANAGGPVSGT